MSESTHNWEYPEVCCYDPRTFSCVLPGPAFAFDVFASTSVPLHQSPCYSIGLQPLYDTV